MPNSIGTVTIGHPVDVASGTLSHDFDDFTLPGRPPLVFGRRYSTALLTKPEGMFGQGWCSPFEITLLQDLDGYHLVANNGETEVVFDCDAERLRTGATVGNPGEFHEIRQEGRFLIVTRWQPLSEEVRRYYFESSGRESWVLVSLQNLTGQGIDLGRDHDGRLTTLSQRRERRGYRLTYTRAGRVSEVHLVASDRSAGRRVLQYHYGPDERLTEVVDALGNRSAYRYDEAGRMTREVTAAGMVYHFHYDASGRCIETTGLDDFDRNSLEIRTAERMTLATDSRGNTTTFHWNSRGQVEQQISPLGRVRSTTFDDHGRIVKRTNAAGDASTYEYDTRGNLVAETALTGARTVFEYNDEHQIVAITDPLGHQSQRSFDSLGRRVSTTDALGHASTLEYDDQGNLVTFQDFSGARHHFEWNDRGQLRSVTDALGNRTEYSYDEEGWPASVTDPLGRQTAIRVDELGRAREITFPDGSSRKLAWNVYHQLTERVDELRHVDRWRYAACGAPVEEIGADGTRVTYVWGTIPGQLLSVVNQHGHATSYEYDADNRLIREIGFEKDTREYVYGDGEQFAAVIDAAGHRTDITRDAAGAITGVSRPDGSRTSYQYDLRGLLIKADNGDCPVEREYDAARRLVRERQGPHEIVNAFDRAGNRIRRRSSFGHETAFAWNGNNRIARIAVGSQPPINFSYDAAENEVRRFIDGGVTILRTFDQRGRTAEISVAGSRKLTPGGFAASDGRVVHRRYDHDAAGNVIGVADSHWGSARYAYDDLERVVSASINDSLLERFTYDELGNMMGRHTPDAPGGESGNEYTAGNRLIKSGHTRYEYDRLGRLLRQVGPKGETAFRWNGSSQCEGVTLPDGSEWTYRYDALGRRVEKRSPSQSVQFVWDEDVVLHEVRVADGHERVTSWEFHPDGFTPIAKSDPAGQCLCINDHVGMPRELVTSDGGVVWRAQFTAYGAYVGGVGNETECPVRFQGHWWDAETGLHYNRHRYYSPTAGRYISSDPIGISGGLNTYRYTRNPLNWADPLGLTQLCGTLPPGSTVVEDKSPSYIVYKDANGEQRIRFRAEDAVTLKEANPGRNMTVDTLAGVNGDGKPYVHEGRHRAIGVAQGASIEPGLGGVPGLPGYLDYHHTSSPVDGGVPVKGLTIDNSVPDLSAADAKTQYPDRNG